MSNPRDPETGETSQSGSPGTIIQGAVSTPVNPETGERVH
jgi:hypothetical protein